MLLAGARRQRLAKRGYRSVIIMGPIASDIAQVGGPVFFFCAQKYECLLACSLAKESNARCFRSKYECSLFAYLELAYV